MVDDVLRLRGIDFSEVKLPRYDYANQTKILQERVNLCTTCEIHYGLNTGMVIRYLKGEYVGDSWSSKRFLDKVSPYIDKLEPKKTRNPKNSQTLFFLDNRRRWLNHYRTAPSPMASFGHYLAKNHPTKNPIEPKYSPRSRAPL
jgi:hypothetical protein